MEVKVLDKTVRIIVMTCSFLATAICTHVQADQEPDSSLIRREATACFDSGAVVLPGGSDSAALAEVDFAVPAIETLLKACSAEVVALAFPDFDASDSIRISPTGDTVRLPDLSNVFEIRFPTGADIESICAQLGVPGTQYLTLDSSSGVW